MAVKYNKDVVNTLNLKPNQSFLITKYKKQASYFREKQLKELLNELVELDYSSKIGKIDIDIGLRSILCNYCSCYFITTFNIDFI
jgi:DNA polymerase III delta subunit